MKSVFQVIALVLLSAPFAHAEDASSEALARHSYELANSDIMYQQEIFKALYHQNEEIIALLKDIREEMHQLNVRAAKDTRE